MLCRRFGYVTKKLLWEKHPTRVKLKKTKRHTSKLCSLCDADNKGDHFLQCRTVNTSPQYVILRDMYRKKARAVGVPDHLIDHTNCMMQGIVLSPKRYPKEVRKVYEQQREVGWKKYLRRRLVQEWGSVLKSPTGKQVKRLQERASKDTSRMATPKVATEVQSCGKAQAD